MSDALRQLRRFHRRRFALRELWAVPVIAALGYMLAVLLACAGEFVLLSSEAKRRVGIWLIAKADSEEIARQYFKQRREQLRQSQR
jgi:hypothetical protein